ncbi:hypothetical protein FM110_01505 [Brachybacterium nesterenkovii]|uniref:Uncharacterized protein n=2 Tax=Brachybacterium nesterenkovii TaxID=47847 RepID=A0A1X6WVC6_9MICO|nr:hypothetical protein FM110_01505 [Brachybacterium nesterenkovii]
MLTELYSRLLTDGRIKSDRNTRYNSKSATNEDKKPGLGADTVRKLHYALSPMFDEAVLHGILADNRLFRAECGRAGGAG